MVVRRDGAGQLRLSGDLWRCRTSEMFCFTGKRLKVGFRFLDNKGLRKCTYGRLKMEEEKND